MERTFAIIKPDAVERNVTGKVLDMIEAGGFNIVGMAFPEPAAPSQ